MRHDSKFEVEVARVTRVIPACNIGKLTAKVELLARRCKRLGLPPVTLTVGRSYQALRKPDPEGWVEVTNRNGLDLQTITRIRVVTEVTVSGPDVKLPGFAFLAVIDHLPTEEGVVNVVRRSPKADESYDLSPWRDAAPDCDHCRTKRPRHQTMIVRREADNAVLQVGSTCVKDFTGFARNPETLVAACEWIHLIEGGSLDEEEMMGGGGGRSRFDSLRDYLPWVAKVIREQGWLPRSRATELDGATADIASSHRWMPTKEREKCKPPITKPTMADLWTAYRSIVWARKLTPKSEYEENIHAIALAQIITWKHIGLAASIVAVYLKARERLVRARTMRQGMNPQATAGTPKKREVFKVRCIAHPSTHETAYGVTHRVQFMHLGTGAVMMWWASDDAYTRIEADQKDNPSPFHPGWEGEIKATVKGHEEYKGTMQTTIQRVEILVPGRAAAEAAKRLAWLAEQTCSDCGKVGCADRITDIRTVDGVLTYPMIFVCKRCLAKRTREATRVRREAQAAQAAQAAQEVK